MGNRIGSENFSARFLCLLLVCLAGCTPGPGNPTPRAALRTVEATAWISPSPSASPTQTATLTPIPSPSPTTQPEQLCSPLEGIPPAQLPQIISNPFHPPRLGSDDPHQGVDFADLEPSSRIAIEGRPVQAVLDGKVAAVVVNRFPYGNALLIETPLDDIPEAWIGHLSLPTPAPTLPPDPVLTCPAREATPSWDLRKRSLYLLYGHMKEAPNLKTEQIVTCGQPVGAIGSSGNALNPHLHLEVRVGPSGARFTSLAHYDNSASAEEMSNYCTWRVSNLFQLVDPMQLFSQQE